MKRLSAFLFLILILKFCEVKGQKIEKFKPKTFSKISSVQNNSIISFCYFAKIIDKDGYVYVREKENKNSKIIGQLKSGHVIFIPEDLGTNWLNINYRDDNKELSGYIHRSRVKYINTLENVPMADYDNTFVNFYLRNISINIKTGTFNKESFDTKYFSKDEKGFDKYKGRFMLGTDGYANEAKTFYKSITISIGNYTIKIPETDLQDLFNANNGYTECYFDKTDKTLYIHLTNSDGAGSYVVLFIIKNGIYKRRQVEIPI